MGFNKLSSAEAERLAMLAEEAGEIVQAVGKILRHGYESRHPNGGPCNREALKLEIADLIAVIGAMHASDDIDDPWEVGGIWEKKLKFSHHQE